MFRRVLHILAADSVRLTPFLVFLSFSPLLLTTSLMTAGGVVDAFESTSAESADFTVDDPACDTMIPTFNENVVERGAQEFRIRVFDDNDVETHEYDSANAKVLRVRVEGGPFERAQLQARSVEFPTTQVGRFIKPLPKYFRLVNCSGVHGGAVINDQYVSRRHSSLSWLPPALSRGAIVFFASVIRDGVLLHIRSSFLTPATSANFYVDNRGCGRSHSCFKVGDEGCAFGNDCRYSLKWRCYKQSMLVEGVQSGKLAAFGFATSDKRGVMCISTGERVVAMDVFIFGENAFPNVFERSRSKRLKSAEDVDRIYCRFEMDRPKLNSTDFIYGEVDMYGHPYKLKRWKVPVGNVCEPRSIHSTVSHRPERLSLAALTGHSPGGLRTTVPLYPLALLLQLLLLLRLSRYP